MIPSASSMLPEMASHDMNLLPELSIVLPCYNEAEGLADLVGRFAETGTNVRFELILVDNGSTDHTQEVLPDLLQRYEFARTVRVEQNQGYGHGILTGLKAARGTVLAWSHADLQTDPADVFRAWRLYRQADRPQRTLVKGRRYGRALKEQVISWGMQCAATVLLRTPLHEINAQPKLFHRDLLEHLEQPPLDLSLDLYVLYAARRCGWKLQSFPVSFPPRPHGVSSWATTWQSKARTILRSLKYMGRLAIARPPRRRPESAALSVVEERSAA